MFGAPPRSYEVNPIGEGWTYSFQTAPGTTPAYQKHLTILFDKSSVVVNYWLRQGTVTDPTPPSPTPKVMPAASSANSANPAKDATPKPAVGDPVRTTVTNQSASPLTLKVERNGSTVTQIKILGAGSGSVLLQRGEYGLKLKLNGQCYRAPGFSIASNIANLSMIWNDSNRTSLHPITEEEFAR